MLRTPVGCLHPSCSCEPSQLLYQGAFYHRHTWPLCPSPVCHDVCTQGATYAFNGLKSFWCFMNADFLCHWQDARLLNDRVQSYLISFGTCGWARDGTRQRAKPAWRLLKFTPFTAIYFYFMVSFILTEKLQLPFKFPVIFYKSAAFIETCYIFLKLNNIIRYLEWGTGAILKKMIIIRIIDIIRDPLI